MKKSILSPLFILVILIWCNFGYAADDQPDYWPTIAWRTASPESKGVDSELLAKMMDAIWNMSIRINSVLVVRNGYIVLEANSFSYDPEDTRNIYSCTKSISSALIGIAIDKGYIKDVDQPVLGFFPSRIAKHPDADKNAMTLEHLLTMTTGLECRDSYLYEWSGLRELSWSKDWVQFMVDLPMAEAPGTRFEYCNGATFLLSAILQEQTGMNALSFAEKNFFGPLGISNVVWHPNPQGITIGYGELHLRPRDMAKIGLLYLNNGMWDGNRIISSQYIKASTRKHVTATMPPGYGYQWWIVSPDVYTAIGHRGQFIIVAPEKNIVAVFTSGLLPEDHFIPLGLLSTYILPSVRSSMPLSENPKEEKALKYRIARWQTTSPADRRKIVKKAKKSSPKIIFEEYVNNDYGFSTKYDAELVNKDDQLMSSEDRQQASPLLFRTSGLRGFPVFAVIADDVPQGMALKNTGNYLVDFYKKNPQTTDIKIKKQKLIKLADGTDANYFVITWKYQSLRLIAVGVFAFKNNKMIGAVAGSMEKTPIQYLAGMAKSLRFN